MQRHAILVLVCLAAGTQAAIAQSANCPAPSQIVYIQKVPGQSDADAAANLVEVVAQPNTLVLMAPDVDIDFSSLPTDQQVASNPKVVPDDPLIELGHCTTLASYQPATKINAPADARKLSVAPPIVTNQPVPGSGRTPHSFGPVLRYGTNSNRTDGAAFIEAKCAQDVKLPDPSTGNGARILGFRVFGPDFNDHHTSEKGINVQGCHDVEIANMEIAGWGGEAINVEDSEHQNGIPTQAPRQIFVNIHNNYIHHNQYSTYDHASFGYGVALGIGAFAEISRNVFDYNKHAITANGNAGGYNALTNLILKGGGFLNAFGERDIHIMDVHGTESCIWFLPNLGVGGGIGIGAILGGLLGGLVGPIGAGIGGVIGGIIIGGVGGGIVAYETEHLYNCGDAGLRFVIDGNTFQYNKSYDLRIRGTPKGQAIITNNIFARSSQDDAIKLYSSDNVQIGSTNQYNDDTFGQYGVCDIDGDGIDDLILMTGFSWWFSSGGQYPWSFLKVDPALLKDVRLGDVDGDGHCDVVKDAGDGNWQVASGATADWKPFGNFATPLSEVQFGRFDPTKPDYNPGIRPPTHAFRRDSDGSWWVTSLSPPIVWNEVGSSSFPLSSLRFGDFNGDGVTDVLANEGEGSYWAYSRSANSQWRNLNPTLNDPVNKPNIYIGNMDATDNVDDILRVNLIQTTRSQDSIETWTALWERSANGSAPWSSWKTYNLTVDNAYPEDYVFGAAFVGEFRRDPGASFGQFGRDPGASILTVDMNRIGHFYSPAQGKDQEEWLSLFAY